jgi:hypothetical protein
MPYVKISDPNIIDLAAWHQVINVVNQHSDSINAITNSFGVQGTGLIDWNADTDGVHEFTIGPEKILYGRTKITAANTTSTTGDQIFYGDIDFGDSVSGATTFAAKPIVIATLSVGSGNFANTNHNVILSLYGITQDKYSFRLTRSTNTTANSGPFPNPLTFPLFINWQAIGPT